MEQQQRRVYSLAIGLVAVFTIGTTLLPWVDLSVFAIPATWNGLGTSSDPAVAAENLGPHPYGWYVVAAGVLGVLAAVLLLGRAATQLRGGVGALWLAAAAALAAAAVPIITLVRPSWLVGDFLRELGADEVAGLLGRDLLNVPVLIFTIVALVLLALLCAGTALTLRTPSSTSQPKPAHDPASPVEPASMVEPADDPISPVEPADDPLSMVEPADDPLSMVEPVTNEVSDGVETTPSSPPEPADNPLSMVEPADDPLSMVEPVTNEVSDGVETTPKADDHPQPNRP